MCVLASVHCRAGSACRSRTSITAAVTRTESLPARITLPNTTKRDRNARPRFSAEVGSE